LIWIVIEGQDRPRPAWHVWHPGTGPGAPGAAYVVTGPGEQPLPGLAGAGRVTVIVMGSQASGGRVAWTAAVTRVEPGSGEWDEVIGQLVAGRLNAVLAEGETSPAQRWAASGAVFRLAPVDPPALVDPPAPVDPRAPVDPPAPVDTPAPANTPAPVNKRAPNSRTELPAAPRAVHPRRRLAGHRQRRQNHQSCHSHQCGGFLMHRSVRSLLAVAAGGGLCLAGGMAAAAPAFGASAAHPSSGSGTATPIQHVVVIFQENVSFDHYFGTYPHATNTDGNPFRAQPGTPSVNGLTPGVADPQPQLGQPQTADPGAGPDL
jgi:Phosphoesterase family